MPMAQPVLAPRNANVSSSKHQRNSALVMEVVEEEEQGLPLLSLPSEVLVSICNSVIQLSNPGQLIKLALVSPPRSLGL
eukprot:gene20190-26931_t